jgi:RNA polymerase subunit RPABC4/transcription elongation factor Spt4
VNQVAHHYCQRCGIELGPSRVISILGKRDLLCPACESAQTEAKWVALMLMVGFLLFAGGAVYQWLLK